MSREGVSSCPGSAVPFPRLQLVTATKSLRTAKVSVPTGVALGGGPFINLSRVWGALRAWLP